MTTERGKLLGKLKCQRLGHKWRVQHVGAPGSDGEVRGMAQCARCPAYQNVAIKQNK